jgi:nucleoside-diphosphate-sugar epimerase
LRENKNKKILIFGGSGFLGKNLINMLGEFDFEIIVFSQKKTLEKKNLKYIPQNNLKIVALEFR